MATIVHVNLAERSYPIYIAPGLWQQPSPLTDHIQGKRVCIVSNSVVFPLYGEQILSLLVGYQVDHIILNDGEAEKNLTNFEHIMSHLLQHKHGRDSTLIALGGGVVGDITGFAAACYQRGIAFIQIPTTLLSQVDSSVGGKTAVNHALGKNMIGAFYQPQAVLIDINSLNSLPVREFNAGMAEVIKYGILADADFFAWLEQQCDAITAGTPASLAKLIERCCQCKADIVAQDETETGVRALLNLGHTFGHAIEAELGYGTWLHGEAVAAGMVLAGQLSVELNLLKLSELRRIEALLSHFDLPIQAPAQMGFNDFVKHMQRDKKNLNGNMRFVVPTSIGNAVLRDDITEQQLQQIL